MYVCGLRCLYKVDSSSTSSDSDTESSTTAITQERRGHRVLAVPAVRRIAMENKVIPVYIVHDGIYVIQYCCCTVLGMQQRF